MPIFVVKIRDEHVEVLPNTALSFLGGIFIEFFFKNVCKVR